MYIGQYVRKSSPKPEDVTFLVSWPTNLTRQGLSVLWLFVTLGLVSCSTVDSVQTDDQDLPKQSEKTIYLPNVLPIGSDPKAYDVDYRLKFVPVLSSNDFFLASLVRSYIGRELENDGYQVVYNSDEKDSLEFNVSLSYEPDDWPFAFRHVCLWADLRRKSGGMVLHAIASEKNWYGTLGDYEGLSGEEMLADTSRKIVSLVARGVSR